MLKQFLPHRRSYLGVCIAVLLASQTTEAAWLKAYGTADNDSSMSIQYLDKGGYGITGKTGDTNWYGLLDAQGTVLWSKSSGDASVFINHDASVDIYEFRNLATDDNFDFVSINATGKLNIKSGAISNISVEKNKKIIGNDGELDGLSDDKQLIQGTWRTSESNVDQAFAKLDANNSVLWSHLFDISDDDYGEISPFNSGYLLSLSSYEEDPETFALTWIEVLSKLDASGNIIAGSSKKITNTDAGYFPQPQADGSIILIGYSLSSKYFTLMKLDSNFNYVWGKRYFSSNDFDRVHFLYTAQEANNSVLELRGAYRERYNENDELIEKHPLLIKIDTSNGAILSKKEVQISQFDLHSFATPISGKYVLDGTTSDTFSLTSDPKADDDGLFALFSSSLQTEWARTISGSAYDSVDSLEKISGTSSYLLIGTTESWGAGSIDHMIGKLDKNGTVASCSAIQSITPNIIDAEDISAVDIPSTVSDTADPIDNGTFTVTVEEQQHSLEINPVDYPITATNICAAGDLSLSTSQLDFGSVEVKKTANLDVVITNNGDSALKISSISAPIKPFSKISDNCTGKKIAANVGSCKITYKFAPVSVGDFSKALTVKSNDPVNSSISFELKGTGRSIPTLAVQSLSSTDIGIGSKVTITGQGFTINKGKVQIVTGNGTKAASIVSWTENAAVFKLPVVKAGTYPVKIITKENGFIDAGQLTLHAAEIASLDVSSGPKNTQVTINGQYFGTGIKPKVFLVSGKKRNAVTVLAGYADGTVKVKIPALRPGVYGVVVNNSAGDSNSEINFTVQ